MRLLPLRYIGTFALCMTAGLTFIGPAAGKEGTTGGNSTLPAAAPSTRPAREIETRRARDLAINTTGASDEMKAWLKPFDAEPLPFSYTVELFTEDEAVRGYRVTFDSPVKSPWPINNTIPAELYLPREIKGDLPSAIVLDILHGSAVVPRAMARGMAQAGMAGFYVPMACYGARRPPDNAHYAAFSRDPQLAIANVRQTVLDVRRAKALLMTYPHIDPKRISITGVSLGGIMTALCAGVDGGFDRVVPILAGGDLAAITFHARETRLIRAAIEARGMNHADAEKLMAPIDPLRFASRINPKTCLMINATWDEVIPHDTTLALNKAIGSPQILWSPSGHYSAALFLPNIRQRTIDFMLGKKVETLRF